MASDAKSDSLFSLKGDYPFLMKSKPKYRWWKPIAVVILGVVFFALFTFLSIVVLEVLSGGDPQVRAALNPSTDGSYLSGDQNNPFVLLTTFLPLAVCIPSVAIAMFVFGLGGLGTLSSVEGKLRWKRFLSYLPLTLLVAVVIFITVTAVSVMTGETTLGECTVVPAALLVIIIFCPFQCAAEEYVFRGFLFQGLTSWIPVVVIPFIIQALLFALAHGYNSLGLIGVGLTGLCSAWLAVKTGGLEASIIMHSINNVLSFILASLFVSQAAQSTVTVLGLIGNLLLIAAMTVVLYFISKRKGYIVEKRPLADSSAA